MKINYLTLTNIGRYKELQLDFANKKKDKTNVTVFIGNNGAGKTSLLEALRTSLTWFIARLGNEKGSGSPIAQHSILNTANYAEIYISVSFTDNNYQWLLTKTRKGKKSHTKSNLTDVKNLTNNIKEILTNDESANLPIIVYYPVERSVLDIPLKIRNRHNFSQLDGYDNSLNQGVDFRRFFEWFREREDIENEQESDLLNKLFNDSDLHKNDKKSFLEDILNMDLKDPQLQAVRRAIYNFIPTFANIRIQRKPRLQMLVDKYSDKDKQQCEVLDIFQLSQGEKSLMALVGDIARRLAIMNPSLKNPLDGQGIVMIDEVDMHLHPRWQRNLIDRLVNTFPHCQFILTTHSPLVISDSPDVLVYELDNGLVNKVDSLYGQDVNSVLLDVMDTNIRDSVINDKLADLLDSIQDKKINKAQMQLNELQEIIPDNIELLKANLLLKKQIIRLQKQQDNT